MDMFLATGLRPGELLALQFSDVDFRMRTIAVTGTVKAGFRERPASLSFPEI
ncbi:hypothetical protein [Arthrobacter sp. ok909]|uniref:hypothetical protein n=1 Tax=Arthrobacter sp. ok909 TaxID=1761746 RepID=UPI001587DD58|nr:hypothetical protein [Arthrobacter sp. ok909]